MARKAISTRTRFEILKRDGFRCTYCGATPLQTQEPMHVDHVVPVCEGGTNAPENLVTSCAGCNLGKSGVPLEQKRFPAANTTIKDAGKHLEDVKAFLEIQRDILAEKRRAVDEFAAHWEQMVGHMSQRFYDQLAALLASNDHALLYQCMAITAATWANPEEEYEYKSALRQTKYFYGVLRNRKPGGRYFHG